MSARRVRKSISEEVLNDVESIALRLENGKVVSFNLARELRVSTDPTKMQQQAMTAHSRFAFWEYQAARAMREVRRGEIELAKMEGDRRFRYTKTLKEDDQFTPASVVQGFLDCDPEILASRNHLNDLREHWSILKATASALDHRAHLLRRLLQRDHDSIRG